VPRSLSIRLLSIRQSRRRRNRAFGLGPAHKELDARHTPPVTSSSFINLQGGGGGVNVNVVRLAKYTAVARFKSRRPVSARGEFGASAQGHQTTGFSLTMGRLAVDGGIPPGYFASISKGGTWEMCSLYRYETTGLVERDFAPVKLAREGTRSVWIGTSGSWRARKRRNSR
jgi:hypothetical protein